MNGGVLVTVYQDSASVAFPDFPGREIVDAFKSAGFYYAGKAWHGKLATIPTIEGAIGESIRRQIATTQEVQ